jgi:hypothetical protein
MADNTKVIEAHVYHFIKEAVDAANDPDTPDEDSVFFGADLHRHIYQKFDDAKWFGVRVGNGESDLAPNPGATEMAEFDGRLVLVTFARIKESDQSDVEVARTKAFDLARAVAKLFIDDDGVTIGDRVNDARVQRCNRGFDEWDGSLYAVTNVPLLVNDSGGQ